MADKPKSPGKFAYRPGDLVVEPAPRAAPKKAAARKKKKPPAPR